MIILQHDNWTSDDILTFIKILLKLLTRESTLPTDGHNEV